MTNNDSAKALNSAELKSGQGAFEIVKREIKVNEETGEIHHVDINEQIIELSFMLISNFTTNDAGQRHLLGIEGDQKYKFIIAESFFGMFCYFSKNSIFDFVSNIMANLSCLKEGREFMINNKYIEAIVIQMVTYNLSTHRRKFLIQTLRNLLFEYEKYE